MIPHQEYFNKQIARVPAAESMSHLYHPSLGQATMRGLTKVGPVNRNGSQERQLEE